jgi:hypothetical protein
MFSISLNMCGDLSKLNLFDRDPIYDPEYDNRNTAVGDLCSVLADSEVVQFKVSGFGQDVWPVDVRYDLVSILEQFPDVLQSVVSNNYPVELYFYEQGIERKLILEKYGELIRLKCLSCTDWVPVPKEIHMPQHLVVSQLIEFRDKFLEIVITGLPKLSHHSLFLEWVKLSEVTGDVVE